MSEELLLKTESDILTPLREIYAHNYEGGRSVYELERLSHALREPIVHGLIQARNAPWHSFFRSVGSLALSLLGSEFVEADFVVMLMEKHRRYGMKSLNGWQELGILTRIDQKIARLVNMTENAQHILGDNGESLHDTLNDIVGYCVIGIQMNRRNRNASVAAAGS